MNNVQRFEELRALAVDRGYPKEVNAQFYIPVRIRSDDRQYIPSNADHTLLFEPEWVKSLVGSEMVETGWLDQSLEVVSMPLYKWLMVQMAMIRADKGDVIGFFHAEVMKTRKSLNELTSLN